MSFQSFFLNQPQDHHYQLQVDSASHSIINAEFNQISSTRLLNSSSLQLNKVQNGTANDNQRATHSVPRANHNIVIINYKQDSDLKRRSLIPDSKHHHTTTEANHQHSNLNLNHQIAQTTMLKTPLLCLLLLLRRSSSARRSGRLPGDLQR